MTSQYIGETSRTLLERTLEHEADAGTQSSKGESSHRRLHASTAHPELPEGVSPNTIFEMRVLKTHKTGKNCR